PVRAQAIPATTGPISPKPQAAHSRTDASGSSRSALHKATAARFAELRSAPKSAAAATRLAGSGSWSCPIKKTRLSADMVHLAMVTCLLAKGVDSLLAYFLSALMPGKRPIPSLTNWSRSSGCVQGRTQRPLQLMAEQELREIS